MNILFSCAGRRRYLLKYFKEVVGDNGLIIGTDMQLNAPALAEADIKIQVPAVYDPYYIDNLLSICNRHNVTAIISLNDLELPILSKNKDRFSEIGVSVIISNPDVIDICFDKYKTANFLESIGLSTPKTYISLFEAKTALDNGSLSFPLVLKPRWGSGSIGVEFVDDMIELDLVYSLLIKKIKKSILFNASTEDNFILIQEKISGREYGLDIVNDLNGINQAVVVKEKLAMRAGETDKAITVDNPIIASIGKVIGEKTNHIANMDCDILEQDGKYYVLELNPRFGGGYPFSHEAGVNVPKALLAWLKHEQHDANDLCPEFGKMFSKCDVLVAL